MKHLIITLKSCETENVLHVTSHLCQARLC